MMSNDYLYDLFINESKPAMERHSGSGYVDPNDPTIILVDEDGNSVTAVLVDEETVFNATANDIREGKVAATEEGVTVGTKEIPGYVATEGTRYILAGREINIKLRSDRCEYTKLQAVICAFNTSLTNSVAAEKVVFGESVYPVNSADLLSTVNKDIDNGQIKLGIMNNSDKPVVIRYITLKEE